MKLKTYNGVLPKKHPMVKPIDLVLIFCLAFQVSAQEILYVHADNGLIIRKEPTRKGEKTGKLDYGASVRIVQRTNFPLSILDDGETINGVWVEIEDLGQSYPKKKGYVFDGYLKEDAPPQRIQLVFNDFVFQMDEIVVWDTKEELAKVHKDRAQVSVELGESPEGKKFYLKNHDYKKIEVYQRFENSITIMNEGPHCDLTEWKHYDSPWQTLKLQEGGNSFMTTTYAPEDWQKFIPVDMTELKLAVKNNCQEHWLDLLMNVKDVNDYPIGISMSRIFLKLILTDKNKVTSEKLIVFNIPMGC